MNKKRIIPITFALDDNFIPFLGVSIKSIIDKASKDNIYKFYVFHNGIKKENIEKFDDFNCEDYTIEFINVSNKINEINRKICVRDNYTEAIYYRFFIPEILSQYDKIIYIDSDTVVVKDIAEMYDIELNDNYIGAVVDEAVAGVQIFKDYVYGYLNVPQPKYFNSGVLLFNAKLCREENLEGQFVAMLDKIIFRVAPDQDYLNVICKDRVKYIDMGWNKLPVENSRFNKKHLGLIHYNLNFKPWHFDGILYEEYFWNVAKTTKFYDEIVKIKANYGEEEKARANKNFERLIELCNECIVDSQNSPIHKEGFLENVRKKAAN